MTALSRRDALLLAEVEGLLAGLIEAAGDCSPRARAQAARMLIQLGLRGLAAAEGSATAAAYLHILAERLRPSPVGRCQVVWTESGTRRLVAREI